MASTQCCRLVEKQDHNNQGHDLFRHSNPTSNGQGHCSGGQSCGGKNGNNTCSGKTQKKKGLLQRIKEKFDGESSSDSDSDGEGHNRKNRSAKKVSVLIY